ncbi:cholinesterase-like isoform X2 [Ptychodera flava]|uniref:cholinesterase-like isoform X2 n=1 Tax=Ptychodera flava TaxID=63121 RepID=UPI00396A13BF
MGKSNLVNGLFYVACAMALGKLNVFCQETDVIARTRNGKIRGKSLDVLGKRVDAFLGIPYAQPPVGELRFKPPVPTFTIWEEVRSATEFSAACWQLNDTSFGNFSGSTMWNPNVPVSEDCLYLNVWTPHPRPRKAAVMVWIHGGSLISGTTSLEIYNGATLSAIEKVVVVSMNYRLGALGFLAMQVDGAPGNMGFIDQLTALQWVKDNIQYFGGDPDEVTLFGESAGAASVGFHLLSPVGGNTFKRAILQSGSAKVPWAITSDDEAMRRALLLAKNVGCGSDHGARNFTTDEVEKLLACLQSKSVEEIVASQYIIDGLDAIGTFAGVVDGKYVKQYPSVSMSKHSFKQASVLIGTNRDEGTWFLPYYVSKYFSLAAPTMNRSAFTGSIEYFLNRENSLVHDAVAFQYTDWSDPDDPALLLEGISGVVGDAAIVCPTIEFAKSYAEAGNDVYLYSFEQLAANSPWPEWFGVIHGDEIAYVVGQPLHQGHGFSDTDRLLSHRIMKYWANFARTGNPNKAEVDDISNDVDEWPKFDLEKQEYCILKGDETQPSVGRTPRPEQCAFWRELYPKLSPLAGGTCLEHLENPRH